MSAPAKRIPAENEPAKSPGSEAAPPNNRFHAALDRVFGLDLRALAALRIALSTLLVASLADRARDFTAFYTDDGVLTSAEAARHGGRFLPWDGVSWLQPFIWLPDPWGSTALFAVAGVAAAFLLVGRQTRAATFLAWLMLTGIDNRNPLIINCGDDLLRMLLFWGLFLPLSARWSADRSRMSSSRSDRVLSVGTAALVTQIALIYVMSALFKSYRDWVSEGSALHYALHLEQFVTPLGLALRDHLPTRFLSTGIWSLELLGALLLLSPLATDRLRYVLVLAFAGMHGGIELTMGIGLFSYVCIAAWMVTLPSAFWDRLERGLAIPSQGKPVRVPDSGARRTPFAGALAAVSLIYVLSWNVWTANVAAHGSWFPFAARWIGYQLRLGQFWGMFSPSPAKVSSWLQLRARIDQRDSVCIRPDGRSCIGSAYDVADVPSERWRKFHERVVQQQGYGLAERYAQFLLRRFERSQHIPATVVVTWATKPSLSPADAGEPIVSRSSVATIELARACDRPPCL
jgi:Vitamin K-dependent gamma-carboxylase